MVDSFWGQKICNAYVNQWEYSKLKENLAWNHFCKARWVWLCQLQIFLANLNAQNLCELFNACSHWWFQKFSKSIIRHYAWLYYKFMRYERVLRTLDVMNIFYSIIINGSSSFSPFIDNFYMEYLNFKHKLKISFELQYLKYSFKCQII